MSQQHENLQSRIESSFLFTKEERESLMLLCVCPEFAQIVADSLLDAFDAEDAAAKSLSRSITRESLSVAREIEAAESVREIAESHPVFV